jgi:UDP-N-acetylglucosamine transferase subunit ALG13
MHWAEKMLQRIHYSFIQKYNYCWVPDFKQPGLAGILSHPVNVISNARYIGGISRFERKEVKKKYDILYIVSGPEPQRSMLEQCLLSQSPADRKCVMVRGVPLASDKLNREGVEVFNHVSATQLNDLILSSDLVVARAGYSTIMDLCKLKKKAVLIPTPGQTEQEYLGRHLRQERLFLSYQQPDFYLQGAIEASSFFPYHSMDEDWNQYKKVVETFVASL